MSWAATRRPEEELDLVLGRPSAAGEEDQEEGQDSRARTSPQGWPEGQGREVRRPAAAGEQGQDNRAQTSPRGWPQGQGGEVRRPSAAGEEGREEGRKADTFPRGEDQEQGEGQGRSRGIATLPVKSARGLSPRGAVKQSRPENHGAAGHRGAEHQQGTAGAGGEQGREGPPRGEGQGRGRDREGQRQAGNCALRGRPADRHTWGEPCLSPRSHGSGRPGAPPAFHDEGDAVFGWADRANEDQALLAATLDESGCRPAENLKGPFLKGGAGQGKGSALGPAHGQVVHCPQGANLEEGPSSRVGASLAQQTPGGLGGASWGLTGTTDLARQEQAKGGHQGEGISLQGEDRAGQGGQGGAAGLPFIVGVLLDGWDWLEGGPAETDLVEVTGPGTGNLAGHTFQNLQEGPSSRVGADLTEGAAQEAAEGQGGPALGWRVGRNAGQAAPDTSWQDLEEGLPSRVGADLTEGAAEQAATGLGSMEAGSTVASQGARPARDGEGLAARSSSCLTLDEGPGSEVLSPSVAFLSGFLAAGLRPSGAFVSRGAGLLSQARARVRAFALLPGFGLGLSRAALPRRKARASGSGATS